VTFRVNGKHYQERRRETPPAGLMGSIERDIRDARRIHRSGKA
jgi:hypothetical protein